MFPKFTMNFPQGQKVVGKKRKPRLQGEHRQSTYLAEVRAVAALSELGSDTSSTAGSRSVTDGGNGLSRANGRRSSSLLGGGDLDTGSGLLDVDGLVFELFIPYYPK